MDTESDTDLNCRIKLKENIMQKLFEHICRMHNNRRIKT